MHRIKEIFKGEQYQQIWESLSGYEDRYGEYDAIPPKLAYKSEKQYQKPVVSFLVPTCSRAEDLTEALGSIESNAPRWPYEIIVVDNSGQLDAHGNPSLRQVGKKNYQNLFYYINEKNIGMAGNWNRCIQLARGKYVAMLHDDDLLTPEYFAQLPKLVKTANKHAGGGMGCN